MPSRTEFFNKVGKIALGTRMRMLSESIMEDAKGIYEMYDVALKPKWFPVFYVLSKNEEKSITAIAKEIGHSHPSVSKTIREMVKAGVAIEQKDKSDGRKNMLQLTEKGRDLALKIEDQYTDIDSAVGEALAQTTHNIWKAMEELEFLLDDQSMLYRVRKAKKIRESKKIKIVPYESQHKQFFFDVNEEWISQYFKMEAADYKALQNPKDYIIDNGGAILVALYEDEPVGVCALIKMDHAEYGYELAKMGVLPKMHGKGIGWILGKACAEKARTMGAKKIYLESNTVLTPAITLYHKLGFKKVKGLDTPYERCNIKMSLSLDYKE